MILAIPEEHEQTLRATPTINPMQQTAFLIRTHMQSTPDPLMHITILLPPTGSQPADSGPESGSSLQRRRRSDGEISITVCNTSAQDSDPREKPIASW